MPTVAYILENQSFAIWRQQTNLGFDEIDLRLTIANNLSDLADVVAARQNLGVEIGVDIAAYVKNNTTATAAPGVNDDDTLGYTPGSIWINTITKEVWICVDNTTATADWANTTLELGELGTMASQDSDSVNITGGDITGITPLATAEGGLGADNIGDQRTNLDVYSKAEVDAIATDDAIAMALALG